MKIIFGVKNLGRHTWKSVVAIGVFDGVHIGHRKIIGKTIKKAGLIKAKAIVLTFDPHPLYKLHPEKRPPRLMSLAHKLRLFEELGVDICLIVRFDRHFAKTEPEVFIKDILVDKLNAAGIFVGSDFRFGRGKKGSLADLRAFGKKYKFFVRGIRPVKQNGITASSSLLRKIISEGNLSLAQKLLKRPVSVLGTVVRGDMLGRILGFPTANINPHHEVIPPSGVYAVKIRLQNNLFSGILNIGSRPTFKSGEDAEPTIEAHIFNFSKNIYGSDIEILFIKKIREEKRFLSKEDLIEQIKKDVRKARQILGGGGK